MIATLAFVLCLAALAWPRWADVRDEIRTSADAHLAHKVAHPGWSFPARVWSAPAPLALPWKRLVAHARIRGYEEVCPAEAPGQFCRADEAIIPRGGRFAEGEQPPGTEGWTRPLALEPVLVGHLIGPDSEIRWHLPLSEAPRVLVDAIVFAEDEAYYAHHGVNLPALLRATWANVRHKSYSQGASTLTMQVVRNLTQQKRKTMGRKAREVLQAVALDSYIGKDAVLQMYLDAPYLGQMGDFSICGFRAAAWYYWGKQVEDLSLSEAATLAGILPAPGRFSPEKHPEAARERRDLVLGRMAEHGYDVAAALAEPITASPHPLPEDRYTAYHQATRAWLLAELGKDTVYGAGLDVFTALDVVAQERSEELLPKRIKYLHDNVGHLSPDPLQAAAVLIEPQTGLLAAVYGGDMGLATDFSRATQAKRQAGSSFKPLVYALAFSRVDAEGKPLFTAAHTEPNSPRVFPGTNGWSPRNVGGEYSTTTCLANGLAWSQNIATASLLEELGGPKELIRLAGDFGFDTSGFPEEMGLALGQAEVTPLEMARYVAAVINGGNRTSGSPVALAVDAAGVVRHEAPPPGPRVLTPEGAALTRDLMRLVIEYGTGGASRGAGGFPGYGGPAIGKTGTTDSEHDLWFVGGTPTYAGAIWLGYDQPARIGASASDLAAPLWGWWMREVMLDLPSPDFTDLELKHRAICTVTGLAPNETCRAIGAPFLEGTGPVGYCGIQHEPEPAEDEVELDANGEPKKKYENLWKRKAREAEEAETSGGEPPGDGEGAVAP